MRANGFEEHSIANAANAADEHLASIRRAIAAGVTLVNGTDYPPGDLVDGVPAAVHELLLMAAAGLTPLQALQSVSVQRGRAARHRVDHVGQVRPGYAADLSRWPGTPGRPDRPARRSRLVVQGGRVIREAAPPVTPGRGGTPTASGWQEQAGYSRAVRRGHGHHGQRHHRHRPGRGRAVPGRHRSARRGSACSGSLAGGGRARRPAGRRGAHGGLPRARRRAGRKPPRRTARRSAGRARPARCCTSPG